MRRKELKRVKKIQSFLGLTGFYRRFIPKYAEIANPLTELTKEKAEWKFGEEEKRAWDALRRRCVEAPVLVQADFTKEFLLDTDASKTGIGGALLQVGDDGRLHPISFISRK